MPTIESEDQTDLRVIQMNPAGPSTVLAIDHPMPFSIARFVFTARRRGGRGVAPTDRRDLLGRVAIKREETKKKNETLLHDAVRGFA